MELTKEIISETKKLNPAIANIMQLAFDQSEEIKLLKKRVKEYYDIIDGIDKNTVICN